MNTTLDTFNTLDSKMETMPQGDEEDSYSATTDDESPTQEAPKKPEIAAKENQKVVYSRILVCVVLLVCAATAAALTFVVTKNEENDNFERDFAGIASEIIEVSQTAENNLVKIMHDFGTSITSTAMAMEQTWPNVTVPDFYRRAMASQDVSGGRFLALTIAVDATDEARASWNQYSNENIGWYNESHKLAGTTPGPIIPFMMSLNPAWGGEEDTENPAAIPSYGTQLHLVDWQVAPPPTNNPLLIRVDWRHEFTERWNYMNETGRTARSPIVDLNGWLEEPTTDPMNLYYQPVFSDFSETKSLVAMVHMALNWHDHFENLLHDETEGIMVVLKSTCGDLMTLQIDGSTVTNLGDGDLHDREFEYLGQTAGLTLALNEILEGSAESEKGISCGYSLTVYPSSKFQESYTTMKPLGYMLVVLGIFAFTSFVFILYDLLVQKRQETVMDSAVKTNDIVDSLFPDQFRQQMLDNAGAHTNRKKSQKDAFHAPSVRKSLNQFVEGGEFEDDEAKLFLSKPVADLFPAATVMMADICGFTAWSSVREPTQVFTLLESIYSAFDKIAERRKVFKVETVSDSYVCVAGVPTPMAQHATAMARFARDCAYKLPQIVHKLERFLGPGTGDITMRFGLHSGPVTAGVLRGAKARFQLFGDTVNTTSLIGRAGEGGRIHMSDSTANLLIASGKQSWVEARPDIVHLKGKGSMKTYFLRFSASFSRAGSIVDKTEAATQVEWAKASIVSSLGNSNTANQTQRLVDWSTECLLRLLQQVVANRGSQSKRRNSTVRKVLPSHAPLEEVVEVIALPRFKTAVNTIDPETVDLGSEVKEQLHRYISWIASAYNANPFHNFEHASHVTMSVTKLLSRIIAPNDAFGIEESYKEAALHDHTYGITSDPLVQFACAFSALIHDADHRGVPNGQLVVEDPLLGNLYDQSAAEQNSVYISWAKLMSDEFKDLRACIYSNQQELKRFRQVVVNTVLATDIFDPKLKKLRNERWNKAFQGAEPSSQEVERADPHEDVNRKATIVLEHIIQASDVSHTMQHWHVYTKWNEKLYAEMLKAYQEGRSDKDPTDGWYGGELWFYDNYVIPLAKKLAECGVFGVSSDEYLNYAQENRKEWAQKGKDIVASMALKYKGTSEKSQEQALPPTSNPETKVFSVKTEVEC